MTQQAEPLQTAPAHSVMRCSRITRSRPVRSALLALGLSVISCATATTQRRFCRVLSRWVAKGSGSALNKLVGKWHRRDKGAKNEGGAGLCSALHQFPQPTDSQFSPTLWLRLHRSHHQAVFK